jgi:hypothetical protein
MFTGSVHRHQDSIRHLDPQQGPRGVSLLQPVSKSGQIQDLLDPQLAEELTKVFNNQRVHNE